MAESQQTRDFLMGSFEGGWIVKRGTAAQQNSLLDLTNAHVEPDSILRGRQGTLKINTQQLTDGTDTANATSVHSHIVHGTIRYIGVGTKVKRGLDPGVDILTGMSGRRFQFSSMSPSTAVSQQWTYFANGDGTAFSHGAATGDTRKKDNGTETRNWGIDGPNAAPTVALNASQPDSFDIDTFAAAYTPQDGLGTEGADGDPYDTSARLFTVPQKRSERYRRMFAVGDLSVFGDQAFIRIMLKVGHAQFLDHVELAINVSAGTDFTDDFYWIRVPGSSFAQDNSWQEFKFHETEFQRVRPTGGSTQGWADANGVQITVAGSTDTDVGASVKVSADDLRLEADTHPEGTFDYKVTWWNEDLKIESNSRQLADIYNLVDQISTPPLLAHRQAIDVTRVATTADIQVTHWRLWRRNRDSGGVFQLVDKIPLTTTVYTDKKGDDELGETLGLIDSSGVQNEINHIPPVGRFTIEFDDRVFIAGMRNQAFVGAITATLDDPGDLNDLTMGLVFTGQTQQTYTIIIDSAGTPDTFKWSDDGGVIFTTGVAITGAAQDLSFGMTITFGATTGHTLNDKWEFSAIGTGDEESPYSFRWSRKFYPDAFPLQNYQLAGSPVDPIRGWEKWEGRLWIFTKQRIYRVTPFNDNYNVEVTEAPIGTDSPYSIAASSYGIFYYGASDGPYQFNGTTSRSIASMQLEPFIHGETVRQDGIVIFGVKPVTVDEYENIVAVYYNRTYRFFIDDLNKDCRVYVYHIDQPGQPWDKRSGIGWEMRRFRWEKGEGPNADIIDNLEGGTADGWLIWYETHGDLAADEEVESVPIAIQHTFDAELKPADHEIDTKGVLIDMDTGGVSSAVLAELSVDDAPLYPLGMQSAFGRQKLFFPVSDGEGQPDGIIGYKASVRLTIWQKQVRVTVYGIGPRYWVEPRKDSSFTGQYTFSRSRGWCRRGNLILRGTDAMVVTLYADGERKHQVTLPASGNRRQSYRVSCPVGVEGKILTYRIESEEGLVVYPESYWEVAELDADRALAPWRLVA